MRVCCVKNCRNNSTTIVDEKITFFKFPKKQVLRRQWKEIVDLNTKIISTSLVCCDHFEPKNIYIRRGTPHLHPDTIPTIFAGSSEFCNIKPEKSMSSLLSLEIDIEPDNSMPSSLLSDEIKIEPENSMSSSLLSDEANTEPENYMSLLLPDEVNIEPDNTVSSSLSSKEDNYEPITKKSKLNLPVRIFIPLPTSQGSNILVSPKSDVDEINDETPLSSDLFVEIPKKITIKKALKSSTFEGNFSLSETLMRTKSKLEILRVAYENLQKKVKNLNQILRRRNKKILQMKKRLQDEKRKNLIDEEQLINLLGMSAPIRELLRRQHRKVKGKPISKVYPEELRVFAMNLYHYSPKAYEYVRTVFHSLLPNIKTLAQWKRGVNANTGYTEESFDTINAGFTEESFETTNADFTEKSFDTNSDEFTEEFLIE